MAGPSSFASDPGFVARAREQLDTIATAVSDMESAQRKVIGALVELWPTSGWLAAGCRTPKAWLRAHTGQSSHEAARLEAIARLCTRSDVLLDAVLDGVFPIGWADKLARAITDERAPWFSDEFVAALLKEIDRGLDEDGFEDILRYFKDLVDQELKPRNVHPHTLTTSQSLFGGGCVFPGCDRPPQHCDAHHLEHREHGGATTVENACLLCRFHHRLIHAHNWKLHQDPDGRWVATDTHGNAWKVPRPSDSDAP